MFEAICRRLTVSQFKERKQHAFIGSDFAGLTSLASLRLCAEFPLNDPSSVKNRRRFYGDAGTASILIWLVASTVTVPVMRALEKTEACVTALVPGNGTRVPLNTMFCFNVRF